MNSIEELDQATISLLDNTIKEHQAELVDLRYQSINSSHSISCSAKSIPYIQTIMKNNGLILNSDHMFVDPFLSRTTIVLDCVQQENNNGSYFSLQKSLTDFDKASSLQASIKIEFYIFKTIKTTLDNSQTKLQIIALDQPPSLKTNINCCDKNNTQTAPLNIPDGLNHDLLSEMVALIANILDISSHYEVLPNGKCAISLPKMDLIKLCRCFNITRYIIKNVAYTYDFTACFLAQPIQNIPGSSLTINLHFKDKELITQFYNQIKEYSTYYSCLNKPQINSYKFKNTQEPIILSENQITVSSIDPMANLYFVLGGISTIIRQEYDGSNNVIPPKNLHKALDLLKEYEGHLISGRFFDKKLLQSYYKMIEDHIDDLHKFVSPAEHSLIS